MSEACWRAVVDDRARKDLRLIDPPTRERILSAIERLAKGAELAGDIKRLRGSGESPLGGVDDQNLVNMVDGEERELLPGLIAGRADLHD